jgi:CubicO group peptidase (beta-lactamase class C family)
MTSLHRRAFGQGIAALACSAAARGGADALDAVLNPPGGPPMAAAGVIARRGDGAVAFRAIAGQAFGPAGPGPFAFDQPFRVASVSKMVATSVLLTVGPHVHLNLDADASDYVGFRLRHPAWPDVPITPRMILSHTSALRNGKSYPVPLGHKLGEAFQPGGRDYDHGAWFGPAEHRPGDFFAYADVNFALAAQMLETLSCDRFDIILRDGLFKPMGLDVGYNWASVSAAKRARACAGVHRQDGQWVPQVDATVLPAPKVAFTRPPDQPDLDEEDYRTGENGFVFSPQGGLRVSLDDMDALARLYAGRGGWRGKPLIARAALEAMQRPQWIYDPARPKGEIDGGLLQAYGLGCEIPNGRPGPGGDAFFGAGSADWRGHFGDAYGWITGLFWNRRTGATLVYAINGMPETGRPKAAASALTAPEEALVAAALGTPPAAAPPASAPARATR